MPNTSKQSAVAQKGALSARPRISHLSPWAKMSPSSKISFAPRWKETLDCHTPWGSFCVEITMGVLHVYFPDEAKWKESAPVHQQDKWPAIVDALRRWCAQEKIPLSIESDAWANFPNEAKV